MKYKLKPIEFEAFQYTGNLTNAPEWAKEAFENRIMYYAPLNFRDYHELFVDTLEGRHHVSINDYIIKGTENSVCVCKKDIFEKISNPIDERPICKATGLRCSNCQPVCEHRSEE